jgi:hypothetical protein
VNPQVARAHKLWSMFIRPGMELVRSGTPSALGGSPMCEAAGSKVDRAACNHGDRAAASLKLPVSAVPYTADAAALACRPGKATLDLSRPRGQGRPRIQAFVGNMAAENSA